MSGEKEAGMVDEVRGHATDEGALGLGLGQQRQFLAVALGGRQLHQ
jgi:hypothetical protein